MSGDEETVLELGEGVTEDRATGYAVYDPTELRYVTGKLRRKPTEKQLEAYGEAGLEVRRV